jgi:hypothetical protein
MGEHDVEMVIVRKTVAMIAIRLIIPRIEGDTPKRPTF